MGVHVNMAEAKARLLELVAALLRGEEVILQRAGKPLARIMPLVEAMESEEDRRARFGAQRRAALGMWKNKVAGRDIDVRALKLGDDELTVHWRVKFGFPD